MKKFCTVLVSCLLLSSCCTLFTDTKQTITFRAPNGTKIYDANNNVKVAEVTGNQTVTARLRKRREERILVAQLPGHLPTTFALEPAFNTTALWNLLFWPGFLIDFVSQKMFKWDETVIPIELEPDVDAEKYLNE